MEVNEILQKCFGLGATKPIKVYPIYKDWKWYIEADINGRKKRFDKPVEPKDLNESIIKTYTFLAEKL